MKRILRIYIEAYRGLPREIWKLSAVFFVSRSGNMVMTFLTLYLTKVLGYSLGTASEVLAVYGLGKFTGAFVGGWLCDRLGAVRTQFMSLALSGLGFFLLERLRTLPAIVAMTFFVATTATAFSPANLAAVAAFSPPHLQARAVALNRMALSLGLAAGASIGGWLAMHDYALIFWVEGGTCLAAAAILAFFFWSHEATARPPRDSATSGFDVHPLRDGTFLAFLFLTFLATFIIYQAWSTYPVYLNQVYGLAESQYGLLMALNGFLTFFFEMVITHFTARFRPLAMTGVGTFLIGLGFAILPLGSTMPFAVASIVVWTMGDMLGSPAAGGWVARRAGALHRGKYMGLYTMTFALGWVVAPAGGAFLYQKSGPGSLWLAAGMLGVLLWAGFELLRFWDGRTERSRQRPESKRG